ncbi:hypothetical protein THRCLA_21439 [Thraustotheca clavata]|uniref:Uncharacterized protein n=1 Tax=Thraustotheca clavata TaxID=74557 RepID=A0A1V9ZWK8_9STRA|nr:hypothetical protein THRCLA_21439 [Thraustotheca clavata]
MPPIAFRVIFVVTTVIYVCPKKGDTTGTEISLSFHFISKKGDTTVADWIKTLKNYISAGKYVASSDSTRHIVHKAKTCVFDVALKSTKVSTTEIQTQGQEVMVVKNDADNIVTGINTKA